MAQIRTELRRHCPRCDKDVYFQIDMCYVDYNSCGFEQRMRELGAEI